MASSNILIVESINDKFFIENITNYLNDIDLEVDEPVCSIDDYECLDGLSQKKLENKLHELIINIEKNGIEKVGILLDADESGLDSKIDIIDKALKKVGSKINISETNTWYTCNDLNIEISCHILNIDGKGELETVLKTVKRESSIYADCLES